MEFQFHILCSYGKLVLPTLQWRMFRSNFVRKPSASRQSWDQNHGMNIWYIVIDHGQDQRSQLIPAIGTRKMSRTCYMLKCWLQVRQKVLLIVHNPCNRKNVPAGHLKIYRFSLFDAFISFIKVDCACCLYSWRTFPITKVVHAACIHGVLKFSITY